MPASSSTCSLIRTDRPPGHALHERTIRRRRRPKSHRRWSGSQPPAVSVQDLPLRLVATALSPRLRAQSAGRMQVVALSWRDLANPMAGGAELVLDSVLTGLEDRGFDVALVCGGPVAERSYRVVRAGERTPSTCWRPSPVSLASEAPMSSSTWRTGFRTSPLSGGAVRRCAWCITCTPTNGRPASPGAWRRLSVCSRPA